MALFSNEPTRRQHRVCRLSTSGRLSTPSFSALVVAPTQRGAVPIRAHPERLRHRNRRCRAVHILATKENCLMQDLPAETTMDLFTPIEVGPLTLPNRIVMAPLTRSRAGPRNVPTALSALYYAQRASAGLITSEATQVAPEGQGYISTPGIYSAEQVAGWKCVTSAVHACSGRIVAQLWHVGRISHPSFQPGGALPIAPSAIRPAERKSLHGKRLRGDPHATRA